MVGKKEILTAVGTLCCAVAIGFFMQHSVTGEKRYGPGQDVVDQPVVQTQPKTVSSGAMLDVQEIKLTSAEFEPVVEPDAAPTTEAPVIVATEVTVEPVCDITADARPVAAAMVNLTMQAPCLPNERVTVHHNGMIFTETTSDAGTLDLMVPALATEAVFIVAFTNGEGAVAQTTVEELADFDRVVLQWKGNSGFQIHAREFGAAYGDEGHIWEGAPRDVAAAVTGKGGFLAVMGDQNAADPLLAEIYSFPVVAMQQEGDIDLTVEAEVTDTNCGLEIEAQTLETERAGVVKTQNINLSVPACDAIGTFLVLNNLLQDMKVAIN